MWTLRPCAWPNRVTMKGCVQNPRILPTTESCSMMPRKRSCLLLSTTSAPRNDPYHLKHWQQDCLCLPRHLVTEIPLKRHRWNHHQRWRIVVQHAMVCTRVLGRWWRPWPLTTPRLDHIDSKKRTANIFNCEMLSPGPPGDCLSMATTCPTCKLCNSTAQSTSKHQTPRSTDRSTATTKHKPILSSAIHCWRHSATKQKSKCAWSVSWSNAKEFWEPTWMTPKKATPMCPRAKDTNRKLENVAMNKRLNGQILTLGRARRIEKTQFAWTHWHVRWTQHHLPVDVWNVVLGNTLVNKKRRPTARHWEILVEWPYCALCTNHERKQITWKCTPRKSRYHSCNWTEAVVVTDQTPWLWNKKRNERHQQEMKPRQWTSKIHPSTQITNVMLHGKSQETFTITQLCRQLHIVDLSSSINRMVN